MENLREKIVNYYRTCSTDIYGQIGIISINNFIDSNNQEELNSLKSLMQISTYGGYYGTYKGINAWGSFKCNNLKQKCREAFSQNESRKRNLNRW